MCRRARPVLGPRPPGLRFRRRGWGVDVITVGGRWSEEVGKLKQNVGPIGAVAMARVLKLCLGGR